MPHERKTKLVSLLAASTLLLAACQTPPTDEGVSETSDATAVETPKEEAKIIPDVTVIDQELSGDTLAIKSATVDEKAWVVIHIDNAGAPGDVIGYTSIDMGTNDNVTVKVDQTKATETLYAMLHYDRGNAGIYEFPGVDEVVIKDGQGVTKAFKVTMPKKEQPATTTETKDTSAATSTAKTEPKKEEPKAEPASETPKSEVKSFSLIARKFEFVPNTIEVNEGDTVKITITSQDVDHGFKIAEFGVTKTIPQNQSVTVEFVASKKGTYSMICSVYCGDGHSGMKGTLVVN